MCYHQKKDLTEAGTDRKTVKYATAALPLEEGEDSLQWRTLANSYSFSAPTTSRSATTSSQDTCSVNAKLLNLWNFERHRSHATRDRKRTAHVSTSNIERVSHRIRRLLSARVCRLLNVCLRRLSIGSESHLTVA